jgi:type I restriction enzyme, S subunit
MVNNHLPHGWHWVTLADVQDSAGRAIVSGPFGSNIGSRFFVEHGVPVIRGNNLTDDMTRFVDDGFVFITEQKANELAGCQAVPGDLVFTAAGSLGQVGLIPEKSKYPVYVISNKQMRARLNADLINRLFAFYWFSSPRMVSYIQQLNTGTSVPLINLSILRRLPIPLPPLPEQEAIIHILSTLDDKIELNRRMNETLEAMARALFKSWFVDFDPVRAKMEGRTPEGIDAATAALFPASFEPSELGEIPQGWHPGVLDELADIVMGQSPPGETYNEAGEGLPFYQGVRDFGFRFPTRRVYCTAPTRLAEKGDVLLSVRAPVGELNVAAESCAIGRGVAALRLRTQPGNFLYYLLKDTQPRWEHFEAQRTVFGSASKKDVHKFKVIIPPTELLGCFGRLVKPLDERIELNVRESQTLAALRDALLPKLMSGEIRVKL